MEAGGRNEGERACPVTDCAYEWSSATQLRRHFMYRHPEDYLLLVEGEDRYVKCPQCGKMVREPISDRHFQSKLCRAGTARTTARKHQQACTAARSNPFCLVIGNTALNYVGGFQYLRRVISHDDLDLPACVRNIQRARQKWGDLSKLLRQEGASSELSARLYIVVVSAVLLYGSETWVVTKCIEDLLTSLHNRCARTIGKTFIRKTGDDEWVYRSVTETSRKANLQPLKSYLDKRRANFKKYATTRVLYQTGRGGPTLVQPFPTLWAQNDQLENESNLEITLDCERNLDQDLAIVQN